MCWFLVALEMSFLRNSRPTSAEISKLAEELEMERETVRVWFCNRRQKEKRIGSNGDVSIFIPSVIGRNSKFRKNGIDSYKFFDFGAKENILIYFFLRRNLF